MSSRVRRLLLILAFGFGGSAGAVPSRSFRVTTYKDFSTYGFADQPEVAEFVSNTTYYAVFENSWIFIQNISVDGQNLMWQLHRNLN